jgi:DNA-binding SARP family transcriptional activator
LAIADDLTAALDHLDQEILTRSRATDDATTPAGHGDPDAGKGPSSPLLVIVEPPPTAERVRLAAILLQGTTLGIDAVILGRWPSGDTITVTHDGHSTPVNDSAPGAARQLPVTDVDTARTLLRSLTSARPRSFDDLPHSAAPDRPQTGAPVSGPPVLAADAASVTADPLATPTAPPNTVPNPVESLPGHPAGQTAGSDRPGRRRVDVRVLCATPQLTNPPPPPAAAPPWRPQARELLAYLICHPRGVAEHILFEDVLGDVPGSKVRSRLNTYVYNLHQQLRAVGGPGAYITHTPHGTVMIDPNRVDSDLWHLHRYLHDAATATDTDHRITELRAAVAAYTGPLAADHDYYWIPPIREATRRQAIDAHLNLAELLTHTDPAAAATVIEQAIAHDPYNETLYQHGMRLHAAQHAFPAVAALRNRLVRELADIGTTPTPDTLHLADDLLATS